MRVGERLHNELSPDLRGCYGNGWEHGDYYQSDFIDNVNRELVAQIWESIFVDIVEMVENKLRFEAKEVD